MMHDGDELREKLNPSSRPICLSFLDEHLILVSDW